MLVQTAAGTDRRANLEKIEFLLAGQSGEDLIVLPEVFVLRGDDADYRAAAEPLTGPTVRFLAELARRKHAWMLGGSLLESDGGSVYNTSVLLDRSGRLVASYRKIHLFEAHLEDGKVIRERNAYEPGHEPVLVEIEGWSCGLAICYDLRFPELFRYYSSRGASLLFAPSNFTQRTGRDHWEVLVRARAIENQCFVLAPNQCGTNAVTGVASHGHSLAVGPWGDVLGDGGGEEGVLRVQLDPAEIDRIRRRIPALEHRRLKAF